MMSMRQVRCTVEVRRASMQNTLHSHRPRTMVALRRDEHTKGSTYRLAPYNHKYNQILSCNTNQRTQHQRHLHTPWYPPHPHEPPLRFAIISIAISIFHYQRKGVPDEVDKWHEDGSIVTNHNLSDTLPTVATCLQLLRGYFARPTPKRTLLALDRMQDWSEDTIREETKLYYSLWLAAEDAAMLLRYQIQYMEYELACIGSATDSAAAKLLQQEIILTNRRAGTLEHLARCAKKEFPSSIQLYRIGFSRVTDTLVELGTELALGLAIRLGFAIVVLVPFGLWIWYKWEQDERKGFRKQHQEERDQAEEERKST